jgi:thiol-disulfide isomerase/thioredoxin
MKRLLVIIAMMMSIKTFAQSYEVSKDAENGSVVLKGEITIADIQNESTFTWFVTNGAYNPDPVTTDYLKENLKDYSLVVVMGTWCDDSQNLIPRLYTTLVQSFFPMSQLTIYGVDRTKDALHGEKAKFNIEKVPTIIVYKDGKEKGRIIELVAKSIEDDLAAIIKK